MTDPYFQRMKDLPSTHLMGAGTALCAGCGGLQAVKELHDVLGENVLFVNAAGCMTLLSVYPFTPFRGGWLYTAMASAAAGAQGVRDALDILKVKGDVGAEEDLQVAVIAGDGSSYGMGLSATSAAIDRGLDFLYFCYDNEGYGNTGQQSSPATPHGARTSTDAGGAGLPGIKKDLFGIWVANRPAYAATVIGSEPLDLSRKIARAKEIRGPRMILSLAMCPVGWGYDPADTVAIGQLAVKTGLWPLKEYIDGAVVHTRIPHPRAPVEEYLKRQQRFAHLFEPERNDTVIGEIQAAVDAYWAEVEG